MQPSLATDVKFEPPGPGRWELETTHMQRPITRYASEMLEAGMSVGFAEGGARYGLMIGQMRMSSVHGFAYSQIVPFGARPGATGAPPPRFVMKLLTRLHPGMRRRLKTAKNALEGKRWREDLRYWDTQEKPAAIRAHLALQAQEPRTLPTPELEKYLVACRDHLIAMARVHQIGRAHV